MSKIRLGEEMQMDGDSMFLFAARYALTNHFHAAGLETVFANTERSVEMVVSDSHGVSKSLRLAAYQAMESEGLQWRFAGTAIGASIGDDPAQEIMFNRDNLRFKDTDAAYKDRTEDFSRQVIALLQPDAALK